MVAAAVTGDVLAMCVGPDAVWARRGTETVRVPAVATALGGDRLYGESAAAVAATSAAEAVFDRAGDDVRMQTGLLRYVAAVTGAACDTGTVVVVHPSGWSPRRREMLCTAARHIARNAELVPVAVAAGQVVEVADSERCVVLEVAPRGVTAVALAAGRGGEPALGRLARVPDLGADDVDTDAGFDAVDALVGSVSGPIDPDVVIVTGVPGEPAGVGLCGRIRDRIGRGIRVVPVAAGEILAAIGDAPDGREPTTASAPVPAAESTAHWLRDVRDPAPEPSRWRHAGGWAVAAAGLAAAAVVAWFVVVIAVPVGDTVAHGSADRSDGTAPPPGDAARQTAPGVARGADSSVTLDLGGIRVDLPSRWRVRDLRSVGAARVELLPDSGPDRRIVVVHSRLADGIDTAAVAATLAERAVERGDVIRDLDAATTFGDRPVIAYTEVPDEYSMVRWSVIVEDGVQVAIGCQYLVDEWTGIRSECEQAVHTAVVVP